MADCSDLSAHSSVWCDVFRIRRDSAYDAGFVDLAIYWDQRIASELEADRLRTRNEALSAKMKAKKAQR